MNNQNKTTFFLRHREDAEQNSGGKIYEEDFYLNQQHSFSGRNGLHFFAYGESLWYSRYRQNIQYSRPWWAFEFVTEGDAIFICENIRYDLHPGDLYIIRPETRIISIKPGLSGFLRKKCVLFESNLVDYICENLQGINVVRTETPLRLESIYANIKRLILSQEELFVQTELDIQIYALLAELNRLTTPVQYPLPLCRVLNLIGANLHHEYTLNKLSMECKMSISTLSRLFQNYLNISPINYIIEQRLEYAKQLLKVSNMSLKEIADRCGYKSESFLSRSFKKKFGISPNLFRRS